MYRYEEKEKVFPYAASKSDTGNINVHFVRLPFIFEEDEEKAKIQLADVIKSVFDILYTVTTGEGTEEQVDIVTDMKAKAEERQISLVNAYGSILKKR